MTIGTTEPLKTGKAENQGAERKSTLPRPPGPSFFEMIRIISANKHQPYEVLPEIARRYGDVVNIPVPLPGAHWTFTLVNHPDHVDHIMTKHHLSYVKHRATAELVAGEPPALPLLEGDDWKRTRRPLNPHFSEKGLQHATPALIKGINGRLDTWAAREDEWMDIENELGTVVLDGLMQSMFNETLTTEALAELVDNSRNYAFYVIQLGAMYLFPKWVPRPFPGGKKVHRALMNTVDDMVARRRTSGPRNPADILDVLLTMEAQFPGDADWRYRRMRSEILGLVFAGFETTAEALAWTLGFLVRSPEALKRAYDEVDALGGAPLEHAQMEKLPYLKACFDEAMRLQGAPLNIRVATKDDEIGGYFIPKGSNVLITPYGLQRDPRYWKDPGRFEPNRFLTDKIDRNVFIPFNVGPRMCMGARMAYLEGVFTLAAILQRYTIEVKEDWEPRHLARISTALVGGLPGKVHRRRRISLVA